MSWLSNFRAIAESVGALGRPQPQPEPSSDAFRQRMNRHLHSIRESQRERVRGEDALFAQDCEAALGIGAGRPMTAEFLAVLRFADEAHRTDAAKLRETIRRRLRELSAAERAALFDFVEILRERIGWVAEMRNYNLFIRARDSETLSRFGRSCHNVRRELLQVGFEVDAIRAGRVLGLLASDIPGLYLKGSITAYAGVPKLGIVRDIEKAARNGVGLSETSRQNADRIVALIHDVPENRRPKGPEKTDPPLVTSLKAIAGARQQDGFYARMRSHPAPRLPDLGYSEPSPERIAFWDAVLVEAARLFEDVAHFKAEGGKVSSWLSDREQFAAMFGEADGPILKFGWWNRDTKGEEGFSEYGTNPLNTLLHGEVTPENLLNDRPLTPDYTARLRERARTIADDWRFDFGTPGIPAIELFTLGGKDPPGGLLDHLADAGDGAPTKTWLKECDRLIDRFGVETVLDCLGRWIALGTDVTLPDIDLEAAYHIELYGAALRDRNSLIPETLPQAGAPEYVREARRCALKAAARAPGFLKIRSDKAQSNDRWHLSKVTAPYSENNQIVARGIVLCLSRFPAAQAVPLLERFALGLFATHYQRRLCRSPKALSAIIRSLGQIGTREAAFALGRIRRQVTDKATLKAIDKALGEAGKQLGLSADDMQEIAMADYGIGDGGVRTAELGGLKVELVVSSSTKAGLFTVEADGRHKRGISKTFRAIEGGEEIAAELEEAAKDIELILPEARRRMEAAWRDGRSWDLAGWQDRLVGNGLLRTLTERLIWRFSGPDGGDTVAMVRNGILISPDGEELPAPCQGSRVHLWHPLESAAAAVAAWRDYLTERRIRQPFIQAWRPIYVVTDAERATATYSNRFAGHILEQAPVMGILKKRGWQAYNRTMDGNSAEHERVRLTLPHFGVAAEYWVSGTGSRIQEGTAAERGGRLFAFISTDRVSFYALDPKTGKPEGAPIPIESVSERAFCETMYDIDSVVGRTSIGADRNWQDRGAAATHPLSEVQEFVDYHRRYSSGQTSELARSRHDFLEKVLPGLSIANQCSLTADFLMVDGKLATYRINLGSGNILIAPDDRYLCIVPAGRTGEKESYVPYEGDEILSLVLSKAMMLADDEHIDDKSIVSQILAKR